MDRRIKHSNIWQGVRDHLLRRDDALAGKYPWRTVAREIDMPEAVSRAIMGHALGTGDHAAYGAGPSRAKRAEWMARVDPLKA